MSILPILLIIFIAIILGFLPTIRGKEGEVGVALRLKSLPKLKYTVFNNLLIQRGEYSSQIDHVVVSQYGIFVIETKNYKGWIYGGENSEYWTQNIMGHKYHFYNPILQNQGHVKALQFYLEMNDFPFIPVVAFSSKATLKSQFKEHEVCYIHNLPQCIMRQKDILLSDAEIERTIYLLGKLPKFALKDSRKHKEYVHYQITKSQKAVFNGKCPRCGGTLVQRTGQYGCFYGCSNYPKCKFTTY